jgi:hypothetical protein
MSQTPPVPYTPATATPEGWLWRCAWCGQRASAADATWDAAIDAMMDSHTPACAAYQLWLKAVDKGTEMKPRKRRKPPEAQLTFESLTT